MGKILIDGRFYGLEHAGLGRYTIGLVDNLAKLDNTNIYQILLRKKYFNKINLPSNWSKIECNIKHYSLDEQLRLPAVISRLEFDMFHALNPNIPLLFLLQNKIFLNRKLVITVHDTTQLRANLKATTLPLPYYYLKNIGYKILFRRAIISSDQIITPTIKVKNEIITSYSLKTDKVKAINEGVGDKFDNTNRVNVLNKHNIKKPYFIYVGNLYPHKNVEMAIKAASLLNKNKIRVLFVIVSARNVFTKILEKNTNSIYMSKFVKYMGYIKDEELSTLLALSAGFVYPSLSEGFGLPGLEAMKAGTLLLASDIDVFKEVYRDNAIYFDPNDANSIAKEMRKSLNLSKSLRTKKIKKAKEYVKKYSWEKMAKETLQVYNEALK